ncbi:MAG: hypothetical protein UF228_09240 [Lachnospiraceae bacterium]|nr:hypothetical protein [Lachnospiraceae bacterium]
MRVQKPGKRAIIVDNEIEAKQVKFQFKNYSEKIFDLTSGEIDYHRTRRNLLTVEQAKGLEISSVIAISGRMSMNKKYIAYSRALDELFIYDLELEIDESLSNEPDKTDDETQRNKKKEKKNKSNKPKVERDYTENEVRKFFEDKGLQVNDMRSSGGPLWVIGEQSEIKQYVDEACEKYGISGKYHSSKDIGHKSGWYSKTKK